MKGRGKWCCAGEGRGGVKGQRREGQTAVCVCVCVGPAMEDQGVREGQHLDSELFPCKFDLFSLKDVCVCVCGWDGPGNLSGGENELQQRERSV